MDPRLIRLLIASVFIGLGSGMLKPSQDQTWVEYDTLEPPCRKTAEQKIGRALSISELDYHVELISGAKMPRDSIRPTHSIDIRTRPPLKNVHVHCVATPEIHITTEP